MLDLIFNFISPHVAEIVGFVAGALATGLLWLVKRTKNTVDDKILHETADKINEKK